MFNKKRYISKLIVDKYSAAHDPREHDYTEINILGTEKIKN